MASSSAACSRGRRPVCRWNSTTDGSAVWPRGQPFAEVRVSGHDHPTVLGSVLEDVRIRGIQAQHLADMDRIVTSFA